MSLHQAAVRALRLWRSPHVAEGLLLSLWGEAPPEDAPQEHERVHRGLDNDTGQNAVLKRTPIAQHVINETKQK